MEKLRRAFTLLLSLLFAGCNLGTGTLPNATVEVIPISPTPRVILSCDGLVDAALDTVGDLCGDIGRNQACYGNQLIDVEFQDNATGTFADAGDITNLLDLQRITTTPLDDASQTWGIAILRAQANLPDTLPGQNVTFILFGDTAIEDAAPDMQAVTLETGIGQSSCAEAPPNAMLLQSPEGEQVSININGATLTMGSTLYITAVANGEMIVATLEGTGIVSAVGMARVIQPGAQTRMPLGGNDGLQVIGPPSEPEPFDLLNIQRAPLSLLPETISLPAAITLPGGATVTPPSVATVAVTQSSLGCTPRPDWTGTYSIQRGDTLSAIARRYNLSLQELQDGNCIADADRISVGQVIQVPAPSTAPITTTAASADVTFTIDDNSLNIGECTTVRWNVVGNSIVYFADETVSSQGSQEVCPSQSTNYTLLVVSPSGNQTPYTVSVTVAATSVPPLCPTQQCAAGQSCSTVCPPTSTSTCGNQICEPNSGETSQTCPRDCG